MGCGASKSLKVEPSEDNGSETAATVVSPVYKAPVEKEETIIKILLSTDFDPLSLHNLNSSGGIENWTLAISFKVLCLPSQVVNVFQIITELHDLAGITLYRPCLQAIMSSKEYIELTQGFTVATELSELEAKYLKHLDKLHSSYVMLLKTWYGLCHDANARLRTNSGKDSWVSKKEDVASKCNEARIQYLKFIYSRKEMHIKVATVRTNKLAELIKFFMNIESLVGEFEKRFPQKKLGDPSSSKKQIPTMVLSNVSTRIRWLDSIQKPYKRNFEAYLGLELQTCMHLKDLIEASKYHWPSTSSTASTNVNRKSSAGDGGGKVNSNNASSAIARQQSPFMYKFEFFPKLSDKAQQRSAVPSYASELENFSAQLLDTLIPQLKTKNEQWNAVEQLWRQTMGHTIDQLVADCNDIDSLRTEIDRYRLQTDDHEEDIVQCEKNVKIISGRLLSNLHDLFPKKLLECSKVLIPLLQSIFENLVEQLEAIHPQFTSPELPSMEALNQKNSLNEWFALSTLGRKNSLSRRASASGSINNGSISALSGVTEKKQQPERTQQSLLLSGKEHIATNSKVKFGNIPVTTSYSGGRNGNDAKSITLDTSSKSIVWGVGSNGGGADATSSFLTTPSSPFIQAIENSNSSLRFDSNSINTSSAGVGATLLAPRPSLMQRRPSPAPDLLFKSIGGKFTSEESNDSSDTSDYDDYSGYHSPYSPASGSMGFKVKMILPKNKEILPPSLLMSSSVAVRLNAEAASNTTTKVSFLPPELQTQTLAAGESNSNFGPSISATISSDDIDGSSSTGLLVAPRASLNLRRPSAAPDILKQQFSLFKQDGGRDEEESDEVYSSRSNDLASSAGSSLGKSGNVKQKFLSGGSISFQSDVNESSLFVIKDESNPDEGNNSTSITTATTPEPNISSQFTPDDHENKDSDIQNVAEASGKILEKDGGGEKFPDFATLSGYAMPQD